jgi:hypothetical protein
MNGLQHQWMRKEIFFGLFFQYDNWNIEIKHFLSKSHLTNCVIFKNYERSDEMMSDL